MPRPGDIRPNASVRARSRLVMWGGVAAVLAAAGAIVVVAALWIEHRTPLTLPVPTGSFAVGRVIYDWTDPATKDPLAPVLGTPRELAVWIWYPSVPRHSPALDDYVPRELRAAAAPPDSFVLRLLTRDLSKVRAHSIPNAEVSPASPAYPIVILRTGASQEVMNYTTLAEDLASHGYVVVGFDAPYRTRRTVFPDGRAISRTPENNPELYERQPHAARLIALLNAWTSDMGFVLTRLQQLNDSDPSGRFTRRLDLTRVGVMGHSFGGTQAAQFCAEDARCRAGIDVDGLLLGSVVRTGLHCPFMFLLSDQKPSDAEDRQVLADIQSVYQRLPDSDRVMIKLRGGNHFFFSDDAALLKSHLVLGTLRALGVVGLDGRRQLALTAYCVRQFFGRYLKGTVDSRPGVASPAYPELEILGPSEVTPQRLRQ